ncbi:MAG: alpha/beta fold hydrolase [Actinomycetota bacterium]
MDSVRFSTDDGISLEGELRQSNAARRGSAVLCHPLPQGGGSKDHPLLWSIRNALAERGLAVLTFNFRGVMRSGGTFGGGWAEIHDVRAAITFVREHAVGPTITCGWSFGANVALREALEDERVAALALVGLPLGGAAPNMPPIPSSSELRMFRRPVLLLSGEGDAFCPRPELELLASRLSAAEVEIVAGTDHFFWRREDEVADRVAAFAERVVVGGLG